MKAASAAWWRLLTPQHWFVFSSASLSWFFGCLDSHFFNLARDAASDALLGDRKLATIYAPCTTSVFLLGWAAGGLFFGALGLLQSLSTRGSCLAGLIAWASVCSGRAAACRSVSRRGRRSLQNIVGFLGMLACAWVSQAWGRRPALLGSRVLSFATTLLVFRNLREFEQIYWMLPLMGFGQTAVYAVFIAASAPFTISRITASLGADIEAFRSAGQWVSLLLLSGLVAAPFLPETRHQPLPE